MIIGVTAAPAASAAGGAQTLSGDDHVQHQAQHDHYVNCRKALDDSVRGHALREVQHQFLCAHQIGVQLVNLALDLDDLLVLASQLFQSSLANLTTCCHHVLCSSQRFHCEILNLVCIAK